MNIFQEKKKIPASSIFSFKPPPHIFYSIKDKFHHLTHLTICSYVPNCDPSGEASFDPRGIISTDFVKVQKEMLHTVETRYKAVIGVQGSDPPYIWSEGYKAIIQGDAKYQ